MSADLLRRAAKVLREQADAVSRGDDQWQHVSNTSRTAEGHTGIVFHAGDEEAGIVADTVWPGVDEYMVTMQPATARAVADWLDATADAVETNEEGWSLLETIAEDRTRPAAVATARAILRDAS